MEFKPITSVFLHVTNACNCACKYCAPAGTKILLPDFTEKNIEDVEIGDEVLGTEENSPPYTRKNLKRQEVTQIFKRNTNKLLKIVMQDGKEILLTENHPILNGRGKWTKAKNLKSKSSHIMSISYIPNKKDFANIYNIDYVRGYFIGMWLTDGSFNNYHWKNWQQPVIRLAVKDDEIIERMKRYCDILGFEYTVRPFKISSKYNLFKDAIFSGKKSSYEFIYNMEQDLIKNKETYLNNENYVKGFLAACYDAEGHVDKYSHVISISNSSALILDMWENGLKSLGFNIKRDKATKPKNLNVYRSRILCKGQTFGVEQLKFFTLVSPAIKRKTYQSYENCHIFFRNAIKSIDEIYGDFTVYNFETTEHTYIANGLVVHNCFETARPDYITWQTAKDTVDYLIKNAEATGDTPSINFFGGEPMLCWDSIIVPLTKYIREEYKKPFNLSMTSNCTLMTKERLDFMKANNIGLLFSIDGDKETQNYNRPMKNGSGSWEHIKDIIPLIPKYHPQMTFRSTVIPETAHNVFHNIMFAEKNGYNNFFVVPNVLQEWPEDKKEVLKSEMRKYSDYVIACFRNGGMPIRFSEYDKSFQKIPKINRAISNNEMPTEEKHGACTKCGLGTNRFAAVGPNGDIYGCQELVSTDTSADIFKIGNIYTGIDEARRERLAASYKACVKHGPECQNCRLYRVCDGGCVANNYFATGDINTVAPMYCWWIQVLLEEAIYVCNEMGENPPERFMKYWKECTRGR